jgi:hypothetical protein
MANALVALQNITLASTATSVVFGSIPATFRDLRLIVDAATTAEGNLQIRVNGDTGNNYAQIRMSAYSSGRSSTSITTNSVVTNAATGLQTTARAINVYDIIDYSVTDKHKTILLRADHADEGDALAARWINTAAITSITVMPGSTFAIGSTFSLYGVSA